MSASGKSFRESLRVATRDYSLVVVAIMFVIFGVVVSNNVIPNYHELQQLEKRRDSVEEQVEQERTANGKLQDQIDALDDPYYISQWMVENLNYRPVEPVVEGEETVEK